MVVFLHIGDDPMHYSLEDDGSLENTQLVYRDQMDLCGRKVDGPGQPIFLFIFNKNYLVRQWMGEDIIFKSKIINYRAFHHWWWIINHSFLSNFPFFRCFCCILFCVSMVRGKRRFLYSFIKSC